MHQCSTLNPDFLSVGKSFRKVSFIICLCSSLSNTFPIVWKELNARIALNKYVTDVRMDGKIIYKNFGLISSYPTEFDLMIINYALQDVSLIKALKMKFI